MVFIWLLFKFWTKNNHNNNNKIKMSFWSIIWRFVQLIFPQLIDGGFSFSSNIISFSFACLFIFGLSLIFPNMIAYLLQSHPPSLARLSFISVHLFLSDRPSVQVSYSLILTLFFKEWFWESERHRKRDWHGWDKREWGYGDEREWDIVICEWKKMRERE